ncbi:polyamine ABC transporter, ATP-binding family protein [Burkholderia pseudomallei TSV 25]|uniref:ABC transporter ATP-binding protein n=2 Tax=Burkholderia pseudomallei TaxID=28450 RepID=UPI00050FCCDF|nr:polyamine ABC transporter ATP-binding protein [Burkholderia pseudomallei]AIV48843.1 polyamine ABC transporter, ATP-binding family protein [Burkholderia pseudomallei TSV 48]KGC19876.1 polyamine ABC transporter, ATP-binding family protein [Burkholderia pseudomallei]KGC43424.1 polyamine ABC transporter, ATP-binding family protein [Burkholderia pseudomallei]KGR98999.1 polyamine ABC transporter, ATP-binding family protein [Burkholderia pseudomallei MSHR7504]KGW17475.1 polyamine ABC transporter, 
MNSQSGAAMAGAPSYRPQTGADGRAENFVQIIDVVKKFGETVAVRNVELSVRKGELFALLGSSGCGKSTLLRMLAGLETITSGKILIDGEDLAQMPPYKRPVNMMFQSYALFPHMTVEANVAFGLKQEGVPKAELKERVRDALELVQMARYAGRKPHQLSGGQQQRVALARSLVKRPKLLLLDEPMSALDKQIRQRTQIELVNILDKVGVTCIMVTHDQEEAMTMAGRLAVMSEGQIVQIGTPHEVYEYPNCRFSAEFIGSTNLFEGVTVEDEPDHVFIESPDLPCRLYVNHGITGPLGMPVTVSVRPERIALTRKPADGAYNWGHGVVTNVAYMGGYSLYHVKLDSGKTVIANVSSLAIADLDSPGWGDEIYVRWSAAAGVVLTS